MALAQKRESYRYTYQDYVTWPENERWELIDGRAHGMCTGGRILDHLRDGLEDPRTDILFVDYQAHGTLGRHIVDAASQRNGQVRIDGREYQVRAGIHIMNGYSAHADQKGLLEWVASAPRKPGKIKLVHGEDAARDALREKIKKLG